MMLKKLVLPTAIMTAFAFSPVMADTGNTGGSKAERQQEMQTDSPGTNTGGTSAAYDDQTFDELDRNQDGQLDEDELNTWGGTAAGPAEDQGGQRGEEMIQRYDTNQDGNVSRDEMDEGFNLNEGTGEGTGSGAEAGADL